LSVVNFDARIVEGFVNHYLVPHFARSRAMPDFHREILGLCASDAPNVAIAAPRGHAKTALVNVGFSLAAALLEAHPFQLKISRNRPLAVRFLRAVREILTQNAELIRDFSILPPQEWERDAEEEFVVTTRKGYRFCMGAMGFEQGMRGTIWGSNRPGLILLDDIEDENATHNNEANEKNMRLFMGTVKPMGHDETWFRMIGTVLGATSLLQQFLESPEWTSVRYEACDDEVSEESILWPEMYPRDWWLKRKAEYVAVNNLIQFNMEYRNIAVDYSSGYFQRTDFVENDAEHDDLKPKTYYVGVDYAISTAERRDYTVMVVGGVDDEGFLHIVDVRKGRWDGKQIIDEMFSIEDAFRPERWFVESGAIQKALGAALEIEQRARGVYLSLEPMVPAKDKASRARSIQARLRSKAVRFDKRTPWFADLEEELVQFPRGRHDDQVDAMAWLGQGLANMVTPPTDFETEREQLLAAKRAMETMSFGYGGRNEVTGY
jgi:predicted phage terminase large subunit-like protein